MWMMPTKRKKKSAREREVARARSPTYMLSVFHIYGPTELGGKREKKGEKIIF
jgi:hypothetical protein